MYFSRNTRESPNAAWASRRADAFAATTRRCLDEDGVTDLGGFCGYGCDRRVSRRGPARHHRHTGRDRGLLGDNFVAHGADGGRRRADERHPGGGALFGEDSIFREEAIARVDGVGSAGSGDLRDLLAAQVSFGGSSAGQGIRFVGGANVQCIAVGLGVDGDSGDAHFLQRLGDADGDFATVGNEDLGEHTLRLLTGSVRSGC
jgi:hypothetical protein